MSGRKRGITLRERFEEKYSIAPSGCWEWAASRNQRAGYGQFRVRRQMIYAHRVSWELYRAPIPSGLHVLHRCDNRLCVNPAHLFLGSNDDNMADMVAKKRQAQGMRHGRRKLTDAQVAQIRALKGKMLQREIAALFGIRQTQVSHILRGVHWLTEPDPLLADYQKRYREKVEAA